MTTAGDPAPFELEPDDPLKVSAHPWARFLAARQEVIVWLMESSEPEEVIAHALSCDHLQVRLIYQSALDKRRK